MLSFPRFLLAACATVGATAGIALAAGAPGATTQAATGVGATTATLNATVAPNGSDTSYYFEYGTTATYGTKTPTDGPEKGNGDKAVKANITGLAPSTTYHFRVVASNTSGTVNGADATFTTTAPGATTNALTAASNRGTVTFGKPVTIAGTLTGPSNTGAEVTLEQNPAPYTGGFKSTGLKATTDASGNYAIIVAPATNVHYRIVDKAKKPTTSPEIAINVRVKVTLRLSDRTPKAGQRVRFSGTVLPGHDGTAVSIQRRTSTGKWRTVTTATLVTATPVGATPRSKFAKRLRIRKTGTYRARVVPTDGDHAPGVSARRKATVG